jgi:hypothetical protein
MCREWGKLGGLKLLCNLFGIIPVADNTDDITQASSVCHILISSYFKSISGVVYDGYVRVLTVKNCCIY